jgi:lipopolysaccharide biosynthesis glycosyltransferase
MSPQQHENVVFFTTDQTYLPSAWVAARAAAAEPGRNFDVLLLVEKSAAANIPAPPGCRLLAIELPEIIRHWPSPSHMSVFSYLRLAAPNLWLTQYRRALYLDSDIRIAGPLAPLFSLDLRGATLAMVEDCGNLMRDAASFENFSRYRATIGQNPASIYFNAGVTLFDLAAWRAQSAWPRAIEYVQTHGDRLIFMDQDVLNSLCGGKILELSPAWNFFAHYLSSGLEAELAPRIFHYADILKPWRDPEWRLIHAASHVEAFAALFADTPWPMHPAYTNGPPLLWPVWRRRRTARPQRRLKPEEIASHLAHVKAIAPVLGPRVHRHVTTALAAGRYAPVQ